MIREKDVPLLEQFFSRLCSLFWCLLQIHFFTFFNPLTNQATLTSLILSFFLSFLLFPLLESSRLPQRAALFAGEQPPHRLSFPFISLTLDLSKSNNVAAFTAAAAAE